MLYRVLEFEFCARACVHICVGQRRSWGVIPQALITFVFGTQALSGQKVTRWARLASFRAPGTYLCPQCWDYKDMYHYAQFSELCFRTLCRSAVSISLPPQLLCPLQFLLCVYRYVCMCLYNLLSLFSVAHISVFRADLSSYAGVLSRRQAVSLSQQSLMSLARRLWLRHWNYCPCRHDSCSWHYARHVLTAITLRCHRCLFSSHA